MILYSEVRTNTVTSPKSRILNLNFEPFCNKTIFNISCKMQMLIIISVHWPTDNLSVISRSIPLTSARGKEITAIHKEYKNKL